MQVRSVWTTPEVSVPRLGCVVHSVTWSNIAAAAAAATIAISQLSLHTIHQHISLCRDTEQDWLESGRSSTLLGVVRGVVSKLKLCFVFIFGCDLKCI